MVRYTPQQAKRLSSLFVLFTREGWFKGSESEVNEETLIDRVAWRANRKRNKKSS